MRGSRRICRIALLVVLLLGAWLAVAAAPAGATTIAAPTALQAVTATLPGHVSGTVRNAGGAGLAGVAVQGYLYAQGLGWVKMWTVTTATDGSYDHAGTGTLKLSFYDPAGNYLAEYYDDKATVLAANTVTVTATAPTTGINAVLAPAGRITGAVSNKADTYLSGMSVSAYQPNGSGGWTSFGSTTTTVGGTYDLGRLPAGSYRVSFQDPTGGYATQCYHNKATLALADPVAVTAGATTTGISAVLELKPGSITGTVKDANGAALGGITVEGSLSTGPGTWSVVKSTSTGADGTYRLDGVPSGTYEVRFFDPSGYHLARIYNNRPTWPGDPVVVNAGATTSGIDAVLPPAGVIAGTVKNRSGQALEYIVVEGYRSDGSGGWTKTSWQTTAPNGSYRLPLPPGTYRVRFTDYKSFRTPPYDDQWYNNKLTLAAADDVVVIAGATTPGIDAVVWQPPLLSGFTPTSGSAGTVVALTGFRFIGATKVTFGGASATFKVDSETQITATVPANAVTGKVAVTTGGGTATSATSFTVTVPAIGVTAPTATASWPSGSTQTIAWTLDRPVPAGEFRVGLMNSAGTHLIDKQVLRVADKAVYSTTVAANCPAGTYVPYVRWRPVAGSGAWLSEAKGAAMKVTPLYITNPVAGSSWPSGSTQTLTWVMNPAVSTGEFRVGLLNGAGTAVITKQVLPTAGKTSYALSLPASVPAGNYRAYVYYRATVGGANTWTYVSPAFAVTPINVTQPLAGSFWPRGTTQTVAWTVNPAYASGEFQVGLMNGAGTAYLSKSVLPLAGRTSYSTTLAVACPDGSYRAFVSWRAVRGSGVWTVTAKSGLITVTPINITSPTAASLWPTGSTQVISWSLNPAYTSGEFSVGLVSATGNTSYLSKLVPVVKGQTGYSTSVTVSCLAGAYRAYVSWRPLPGMSWLASARGPAFTVTPTIAITSPAAGSLWPSGSSQTMAWTVKTPRSTGEFRVGLIDAAGAATSVNKQVLPVSGQTSYSTSVDVSCPAGPYRSFVSWRPAVGSGAWTEMGRGAAFTVTPINILRPTTGWAWAWGTTPTIAWTVNPTVSAGEFRLGIVSASGTTYLEQKLPAVAGRASYSSAVKAICPIGSGYRAYVDYRPTVGSGVWTASAKSAAFTVRPLRVTSPTTASRWPSGSTQIVSWTASPETSVGEFRIQLRKNWSTKTFAESLIPANAGRTSYDSYIGVACPADDDYYVRVSWRPAVGSGTWTWDADSGYFTVTPLNVTYPRGGDIWRAGLAQRIDWTTNPAVSSGEFRVGLRNAAGVTFVDQQVSPIAGRTNYSVPLGLSCPADVYSAYVSWRPNVGSGAWTETDSSNRLTVDPAIRILNPVATSRWFPGSAQTVDFSVGGTGAVGEFRVWLDSGTIIGQPHAVPNKTSYSIPYTVACPTGYDRVNVAWRPNIGSGAWVASIESPTFEVRAVPTIVITEPTADTTWLVATYEYVSWTANPAPLVGEFCVRVLNPEATDFVWQRPVSADSRTTYRHSVTTTFPAGVGYVADVMWRPVYGSGPYLAHEWSPPFEVAP